LKIFSFGLVADLNYEALFNTKSLFLLFFRALPLKFGLDGSPPLRSFSLSTFFLRSGGCLSCLKEWENNRISLHRFVDLI